MFTIPFDYEHEMTLIGRTIRAKELEKIKTNLDWIQIIPHGLTHMPREFEKADTEAVKLSLQAIDEAFTKDGLPYEKGFCAPFWLWSQETIDELNKQGWWGAVDRNQPDMKKTDKYYEYNYSLEEPFWESKEDLKLHGHMALPSANNLPDCLLNILKLPPDVEWCYVTDFLEEKK